MRVTWEMKYCELREKLKEKYRKKMMKKKLKEEKKGIPTTDKPSVNNSFRRVVSVDQNFMVEKIRESRDYSFLFSDDTFEPIPKSSNATSRKTSNNVAVRPYELEETEKPAVSSSKIKARYNKIAPKDFTNKNGYVNEKEKNLSSMRNKISREALQVSRKPNLENRKKPNLEPKKQKLQPLKRLRKLRSDDDESDEGEADEAFREIRKMFNTKRFAGRDDRDRDMETNYGDLLKEERKSAKIARAEDREQLRLIMEEERREKSKKCKIGN